MFVRHSSKEIKEIITFCVYSVGRYVYVTRERERERMLHSQVDLAAMKDKRALC